MEITADNINVSSMIKLSRSGRLRVAQQTLLGDFVRRGNREYVIVLFSNRFSFSQREVSHTTNNLLFLSFICWLYHHTFLTVVFLNKVQYIQLLFKLSSFFFNLSFLPPSPVYLQYQCFSVSAWIYHVA